MIKSSIPEPAVQEKKTFAPATRKIFKVIKQTSIDKCGDINLIEGLEKHPRTGVREVKKAVEVDEDVFGKTTKITTHEMKERATGKSPLNILIN